MNMESKYQEAWETHVAIFAALPGAGALIEQYGRVPSFHDGEVEMIHLEAKGVSTIRVSIGFPDIFGGGGAVAVTLTIAEILDVIGLEGFSPQNVLYDLWLRPATVRSDRQPHQWRSVQEGDIEIELEPTYGIGGIIIGRGLEVEWSKGRG